MQVHWQCKCIDRDNHDCFVTQSPLKVSDYSFPYRLKSDTLFYFLPDITLFAADMHRSRNTPTGDNPGSPAITIPMISERYFGPELPCNFA
jgi:hypothetical protein